MWKLAEKVTETDDRQLTGICRANDLRNLWGGGIFT